MAQYCGNCGSQLNNGVCSKCGRVYREMHEPLLLMQCKENMLRRVKIHIIINSILWLCIGIFQICSVLLTFTLNGTWNLTILVGIWNISLCLYNIFTTYNINSNTPSFVQKWDKSIVSILVFCIINLLIQGYLGFILNLHMLYTSYNKQK